MRPEPSGTPWVTTTHTHAGFRFEHCGTREFRFFSRSSDAVYHVDLDSNPPCSCWVATKRSSALGVCPHIQILKHFLQKLNQQTP
jgi:hypothetical protein